MATALFQIQPWTPYWFCIKVVRRLLIFSKEWIARKAKSPVFKHCPSSYRWLFHRLRPHAFARRPWLRTVFDLLSCSWIRFRPNITTTWFHESIYLRKKNDFHPHIYSLFAILSSLFVLLFYFTLGSEGAWLASVPLFKFDFAQRIKYASQVVNIHRNPFVNPAVIAAYTFFVVWIRQFTLRTIFFVFSPAVLAAYTIFVVNPDIFSA